MSEAISLLGLGTAAIGRPQYINIQHDRSTDFSLEHFKNKGIQILDDAYHSGIRYFDTAPGYGMAESLLVDWVKAKKDNSIEVATKWGYTYVANFDPNAEVHEVKEHSLSKLNEQWTQSQKLLPYLSTHQIHSATLETGVLQNKDILNRLAEIKNKFDLQIGITSTGSNQVDILKKALDVEVDGRMLFDLFQVTYNIFDQSLAHLSEGISGLNKKLVIKEALANGRIFPNDNFPHYAKAYKILETLADKYAVGIDAIALRYCMDSIKSFKVLSGASNTEHLAGNLKVNQFELEKDDLVILKGLAVPPVQYWNERKKLSWN
jgi:aryl-alcohol dehydrogenase-like predicted oxidoreductase